MLWVLKKNCLYETVLLSTKKTYVKTDGQENIHFFTLKKFVYFFSYVAHFTICTGLVFSSISCVYNNKIELVFFSCNTTLSWEMRNISFLQHNVQLGNEKDTFLATQR